MSGTQRLRLVLALGVVNLVLATVAFGYGLSAPTPTPDIGAIPTSGTAFATAVPTAPAAASATPVGDRSGREPDARRASAVR